MKRKETFVGCIQQLGKNRLGQFSNRHAVADERPIRIDAGNGDINRLLFDRLEPFFKQGDIHEKTLYFPRPLAVSSEVGVVLAAFAIMASVFKVMFLSPRSTEPM